MEAIAAHPVLSLAALGWRIVPLYGCAPDGRCECGADHVGSEGSRGKHPRHKAWQAKATSDPAKVAAFVESYPKGNWGLFLGPASGVIDVEYDTPEGQATAEKMLAGIATPTYSSGRSVHRLFRWSDELPDVQKVMWRGLECRLGGGGSAAQSVIPPSLHNSGKAYAWLPGLSPAEVTVAELPHAVLVGIVNSNEEIKPSGKKSKARVPLVRVVEEGERVDTMLAYARKEAALCYDPRLADEQLDLWEKMCAMNAYRFRPPLDEPKLKDIHQSVLKYAITAREQETEIKPQEPASETPPPPQPQAAKEEPPSDHPRPLPPPPAPIDASGLPPEIAIYVAHGLEVAYEGEGKKAFATRWHPGTWKLTIVESDPVTYRLFVPAWANTPCAGHITLTLDQFRDAGKMASIVQAQTQSVDLCALPRIWPGIWNGRTAKKNKSCPALRSQLLDVADRDTSDATRKRYVMMADYLVRFLDDAEPANPDKDEPEEYTTKWRTDDTIWFTWSRAWARGIGEKLFSAEQVNDFTDRLEKLDPSFKRRTKRYPHRPKPGEKRGAYCVFTRKQFLKLAWLANDEREDENTDAP